jgi:intraflagellar transport protein 122
MIEKLTHNAVVEKRFKDAAMYFWRLATEMVSIGVQETDPEERERKEAMLVENFWELRRRAEVYYAYSYIHAYIQEPFTTLLPENVFNVALYLWNVLASSSSASHRSTQKILSQSADAGEENQGEPQGRSEGNQSQGKGHLLREVPLGISRVYILYALAKQAQNLGAYKLARMAYDKLQVLRVPPTWQHQIDLSCLGIRSKPYSDQDDLLPVCNWCMTTNPLLRSNMDCCVNCGHPFMRTFLGFDILPLVEFQPDISISTEEAIKLIARDPSRSKGNGGSGWQENISGGAETLTLNDGPGPDVGGTDLFVQKMLDAASIFVPGEPYQPVRMDRETLVELKPEEVYVLPFNKTSQVLPVRFYRSMIPEVAITVCNSCGHFFHQETWELEFLQQKCCPFCGAKEIDNISPLGSMDEFAGKPPKPDY